MESNLKKFTDSEILNNVQAGIIKPLGRHYMQFIFLKFSDNPKNIQELLYKQQPTSTQEQINITDNFKKSKNSVHESIIINFFISHSGFENLGFTNPFSNLSSKEKIDPNENLADNHFFWKGMLHDDVYKKHRDPSPEEGKCEENYQNLSDIHALIILSSNDKSLINSKQLEIADDLLKLSAGKILFYEEGEMMTRIVDGRKVCIEPFGFQDGITDIKFFNKQSNKLNRKILRLVLGESLQSYLVFRKLYQDVEKFNSEVLKLAAKLKGDHSNPIDFVEGQIMGRFKNGLPILFSSSSSSKEADLCEIEKFNNHSIKEESSSEKSLYSTDPDGLKCPFSAHIRSANPRNGKMNVYKDNVPAVIVRRSIPFKYSDKKQGLLFSCFQSNIETQFSIIQGNWLKSDIIAGNKSKKNQKWNSNWNESNQIDKVEFTFKDVVTFKGGEFFFAPPVSYFQEPLPSLPEKAFGDIKPIIFLKDHLQKILDSSEK